MSSTPSSWARRSAAVLVTPRTAGSALGSPLPQREGLHCCGSFFSTRGVSAAPAVQSERKPSTCSGEVETKQLYKAH